MKKATSLLLAAVVSLGLLSGCQVTDSAGRARIDPGIADRPQQFVIFGAGQYEGEMVSALMDEGFKVKPIAMRESVTELVSPGKIVEYRESGYRYGLRLFITPNTSKRCVFSGGYFVTVTMSIVDIEKNTTIGTIRQAGPESECPPLTPVWPLLAKELSRSWR